MLQDGSCEQTCEWTRLARIVESGDDACYGIEWTLSPEGVLVHKEHYNPSWRWEYAKNNGWTGLYTTRSMSHTFKPGEGLVGRVFAGQRVEFVKDLQKVTKFPRAYLAKEYGLHSAVLVPSATGVLEIGSLKVLPDLSTLLPLPIIKAIRESSALPATACTSLVSPERCSQDLKSIVDQNPLVCYAIVWDIAGDGLFQQKEAYNPAWRIAYARKRGLNGLYTTRTAEFRVPPGEDFLGRVFSQKQQLFVPNLQSVTDDDVCDAMPNAGSRIFTLVRLALAREFDIKSALFFPLPNGVLEVGSMRNVQSEKELLGDESMRMVDALERNAKEESPLAFQPSMSSPLEFNRVAPPTPA